MSEPQQPPIKPVDEKILKVAAGLVNGFRIRAGLRKLSYLEAISALEWAKHILIEELIKDDGWTPWTPKESA